MPLYADIWDNDYSSPGHVEGLGRVAGLVAQWENPGGIVQFGLTVRRPGAAAYLGYSGWLGKRLIVRDHFCDRPVLDGTIIGAGLLNGRVHLVAAGPWWRLFDDYEKSNPGAVNSDAFIKTALTNHAAIVNSDQSNICATTVDMTDFTLPAHGLHPGRIIEEMILAGDGSGNPLVFWLQPMLFDRDGKPQKPVAYLVAYSDTADINWQVWARDKVADSNVLTSDIGDLATSVTALWNDAGVSTETAAATNNTATYWTRKRAVSARGMSTAAAAQEVRDAELARLSNPQIRREFALGAQEIMDGNGGRWPLWRMLAGGGYIRDNDAQPSRALFDLSLDYERVGRITTMRYNHGARQLQVAL